MPSERKRDAKEKKGEEAEKGEERGLEKKRKKKGENERKLVWQRIKCVRKARN